MAFDAVLNSTSDWPARCEHWIEESRRATRPRGRRQRPKDPLVLCGHGVSLKVDDGTLLIRNGRTHWPHEPETYRYYRGDPAVPPRIMLLDGSGYISFDVLEWLAEQGVPLVRINWKGEVVSVIGGQGFAADRNKVRWQVETRDDPERRLEFSADLVRRKVENSIATLGELIPPSKARAAAIKKAGATAEFLANRLPQDLTKLRLMEARCASSYFAAWRGLPLKWKATARHPIPDDWRVFTSRTSLANGEKLLNIKASHPLNALLNYAYAVMQAQLQIKAVADGYDPTEGVMHHGRRGKSAFVFDLMEPERPKGDAAILGFALGERFSGADFVIRSDGACRLAPQLARRVCEIVQRVPRRYGYATSTQEPSRSSFTV